MEIQFLFSGISIVVFLFIFRLQHKNRAKAREQSEVLEQSEGIAKLIKDVRGERVTDRDTVLDRFDRLVSPPLDNVRRFSNVALVTGIGGTMLIFFIDAIIFFVVFPTIEPSSPLPQEIITGMTVSGAIALLSSLMGVVFHLLIALRVLDKVQESVISRESEIEELISNGGGEGDPTPNSIGIEEVHGLVKVVKSLHESLLEGQNSLSSSIDETLKQQPESVEAIRENVENLTKNLGTLPEAISKSFTVNEVFEKVARSYIGELSELFKSHRGKLNEVIVENQEEMKRILVGQLADKIDENTLKIYDHIKGTIEENIVAPLERMRNQLHATTDKMPLSAREFGSALQDSAETFNREIFGGLRRAVADDIVAPLDKMREQLNTTTDEIPRAVRAAREFESELRTSVETLRSISKELKMLTERVNTDVTSATLKTLEPVADQMENFNDTVRSTHNELAKIIEGLVNLIRKLVNKIEISEPQG